MPTLILATTVFTRCLCATLRNPIIVAVGLVQPLLYLYLFGPLLTSLSPLNPTPAVTSYDIFVPGLLVQLVLFGAAFSGLSTVTEWRSGELERVLATPAPRIALLGGRVLRDVVVMIIQSILLIAAAFTLGVRQNIGTLALMLVLVGVLTVAIASMSYLFALTTKSEQALAQLANGILLPVTLLAGIMLPMSVAPQWLRSVSRFNPLTYIVDAARSLFDPAQPVWHTWLGFAVATVLAVALFFLAHRKMSSDNQ